jgi:hypothetical protein
MTRQVNNSIYFPKRKGFLIYKLKDKYQALRVMSYGNSISRQFFTEEECYAFLKKHEDEIIPDALDISAHVLPSFYVSVAVH